MAITYNTANGTLSNLFTTTGGGTVFSANLKAATIFDLFSDTAVVNDAIYIGSTDRQAFSDITFNIGTAISATSYTIVWEFSTPGAWLPVTNYQDDTASFSNTGIQSFKFGLPMGWSKKTVNAVAGVYWIRARISAVSGITEGGANASTAVTIKNAVLNIDDYTEEAPCTLSEISTFLSSYPYLGTIKVGDVYDLRQVSLYVNSRLKVTNGETLMIGLSNGASSYCGYNYLGYLQMGDKIDDNFGENGGTLIVYGKNNSGVVEFSANTKMYHSLITGVREWGYPGWQGEWIDNLIQNVNFAGGSATVTNNSIEAPGTWILTGFPSSFSNNRIVVTAGYIGYFYTNSVTIPNLSYTLKGSSDIMWFYQTWNNPTFTFINPNPSLPSINDANKPMVLRQETLTSWTKVWFYDSSAGTYTEYTTQFNDTTVSNAPIGGEVGDMYYFGLASSPGNWTVVVETSLASNDYEYIFEGYSGTSWYALDPVWDLAGNFTINNKEMFFGSNGKTTPHSVIAINGYSGRWLRIRITKKGTGNPNIDRMRVYAGSSGRGAWNTYEKYTLDLKVVDENNDPIPGANIDVSLDSVSVYSGVTDVNGEMLQQTLTNRHWYFDPVNAYANSNHIAEDVSNDYDITITKTGYETYTSKFTLSEKIDSIITLKKWKRLRLDTDGKEYIAINPAKGSRAKILKS